MAIAIVLEGVRNDALPDPAGSLVAQLARRVLALLDVLEAWLAVEPPQLGTGADVKPAWASVAGFWQAVTARAQRAGNSLKRSPDIVELTRRLRSCTLDAGMWPRVFEGSALPLPLLDTGHDRIFEWGGAVVRMSGHEPAAADWSDVMPYDNGDALIKSIHSQQLPGRVEPYLVAARPLPAGTRWRCHSRN